VTYISLESKKKKKKRRKKKRKSNNQKKSINLTAQKHNYTWNSLLANRWIGFGAKPTERLLKF